MVGHLGLTRALPTCHLASFYGVPAMCQSLPSSSVHGLLLPASPFLWISDQEPTPFDCLYPASFSRMSWGLPAKVKGMSRCFWGL